MENKKKQNLFVFLSGLFLSNALLAELIGVKIFSLEKTLGMAQAHIPLFGEHQLGFNLSAGVVIWPVVFIVTDLVNEYFGKKGVRQISFLAAGFIAYCFLSIAVVTWLQPADFWIEVNKNAGGKNDFDINQAFSLVYSQGMGIIIGSLTAFIISQFTDVFIFQWLKKRSGGKGIWLRATGSTVVSQLIDSYVVLFIAFYVFGNWPFSLILSVGIINYSYKFLVALLMTPILYVAHRFIDQYLGKELSESMMREASEKNFFDN